MTLFAQTRTCRTPTYALIAPDGHVQTPLPGWQGTQGVTLISPQMGARFTQTLALMHAGAEGVPPRPGVARFMYVMSGCVRVMIEAETTDLGSEGYVYLPADVPHTLHADTESRVMLLERRYIPLNDITTPKLVVGDALEAIGEPFMGDIGLTVRKLLPDEPGFDMAVNTMTFTPGTALPFVETHIMEHGLVMLEGGGLYRLDQDYHPVTKGDVIWMGPYCPQWFGALGKEDARYLLYKDVGRDPFALEEEG